ncbi:MAG: lactonase family protein [Coprobacillus cateniformis]|uniref:lactonase family protein n=1 Tax=Longibaculum muris TaxID=1796628 RepID=UPI0012B9E10D|nr:lactonase family protein [Longibaculum muris]MBS5112678.1 lactonase family protein [Coprobacillus cateniformis]
MGLFFNKRNVKPVFVGSYGNDLTRGMYVFHLDVDNGEFLKKKYYKSLANPTAMFKRERFIYVCYKNNTGRKTDGGLWQYASMELQFGLAGKATDGGKTYMDCFVNENRSNAYAVDYYNGEVVRIPILKQKIVTVAQRIKHEGSSVDPKRQTEAHPHFIDETPDHKKIFVCDLGTDEVVIYNLDDKGALERDEENTFKVKPGSGPKKMVFAPNGKYSYVLNELSNTICVYQYQDGHFTFIQEVDTYPKDEFAKENLAGDIVISEKGDYLFVTNRGHDSIVAFEVKEDGQLEYIEYLDTDENPRAMILVNDRWLVVASQKGGTIESFELKRGESKGVLFESHFSYMVGEPVCLIEGRGI